MTVPQQAFLRDAMRRLNMTREAFANRIGVSRRALDTWLLPDDSQESRGLPEIVEPIRARRQDVAEAAVVAVPVRPHLGGGNRHVGDRDQCQ